MLSIGRLFLLAIFLMGFTPLGGCAMPPPEQGQDGPGGDGY